MPPRLRLPRPALLLRSRALLAYSLPALAFAQTSPAPATPPDAPVATAPARDTASPVTAPEGPVRIAGANGREVDFAGIWEAMPEGLVVVVSPEAPLSLVTWDKFDLTRLKTEHPSLDAARQRALFLRSPQPVNLGLFAGLLTPAQAGSELRRLLGESLTVKVPLRYRTTTTTSSSTTIVPPRPVIYNGIILPPVPGSQPFEVLSRTDGIVAQDRRDLFDLVKANPVLLTQTADGLDRIAASLPPRHLLPNEPTFITLALRLREFSTGLRELTTSSYIDYSDQMFIRDLLYLADSPQLR
ncbi:MAG: hypothetical protein MUE42_12475 [Opitutaceae bacterium]|nr:hypothetical protein [Opitutaceae bacterium]